MSARKPTPEHQLRDESVAETTKAVLAASRALVGVAVRSLDGIEDSITLPQYRALVVLASRGEQNVGVLAEALEIHPSTRPDCATVSQSRD